MKKLQFVVLTMAIFGCGAKLQNESILVGAILRGDSIEVERFLALGINPNNPSSNGIVPIMAATGSTRIVSDFYSSDTTRLGHENLSILQSLLRHGAKANIENTIGMTPLHFAVYHGRNESVRLLLEFGANPNHPDEMGYTPLIIAATHCMHRVARILIASGADVHAQTLSGEAPAEIAARESCDQVDVYTSITE